MKISFLLTVFFLLQVFILVPSKAQDNSGEPADQIRKSGKHPRISAEIKDLMRKACEGKVKKDPCSITLPSGEVLESSCDVDLRNNLECKVKVPGKK